MAIHITDINEHAVGRLITDHNPWDTQEALTQALITTIIDHYGDDAPAMAKAVANTIEMVVGIKARGGAP